MYQGIIAWGDTDSDSLAEALCESKLAANLTETQSGCDGQWKMREQQVLLPQR